MKCPNCQFDNRQGVKFCEECGAKFELECPACEAKIPFDRKFCGECGFNLKSETEPFRKKTETESLRSDSPVQNTIDMVAPLEGERKHITVLFSDLTGYTAMSERLDPEEVKDITARLFQEITKIIRKYEGFVEKYAGDAVMALFGAAVAHEDDPVRAIKAAQEIHNAVDMLSPQYEEIIEQPLVMHSGINTGLVVTGDINFDQGTHGVTGDTLNVAARLSALGNAGEILVGPDTFYQTEGYFNFEGPSPASIKGKSEPIKVYKVLSQKDQPIKTHRIHGFKAELIGRNVELHQLRDAADKLKEGISSVFSIYGNAGTGKSRLIQEFKETVNFSEYQWLEGQAYPYSQNISYFPLVNLLSRSLQIEEGDPPEEIKTKVEAGLNSLMGENADLIPYVSSLFSIQYPEIENVSPEHWKAQLQKSIKIILGALSERTPTIVCLEDLHWADPSFLNLIRRLISEYRGPVLFLCIYRPTISLFNSNQIRTMGTAYNEIRLQDLSISESQGMVQSLLKTDTIPLDLQRFLQDKVEGNPFYIEEVINSLIEAKTLICDNGRWQITREISEAEISSTIHGLISGRLDRLETDSKRILQEASVIGRTFFYEILNRITELNSQIDTNLRSLERLDLIRTRAMQPDLEYIFKHALTQEVVYNGLLRKERRVIHERIGRVMEQLFHDRKPEFYETLAYHFLQGKSYLKAADYLIKSGAKSLKRYSLEEAHQYYKEAYEILNIRPDKTLEEKKLMIEIILEWALVFYYRCDMKGWKKIFDDHEEMAKSIEDKNKLALFNAWHGFVFLGDDNKKAMRLVTKALALGEDLNDEKIIGYACTWLTWICDDLGLFQEGLAYGARAQKISKAVESDHYLHFKSLGGISMTNWKLGEPQILFQTGKALLEFGKRHGNIRSQTMGNMILGGAHNLVGDIPGFIKCFQNALDVSADMMYDIAAKTYLGLAYILNNQIKEAKQHLSEVVEFTEEYQFDWAGMPALLFLGAANIADGNMTQGLKMIEASKQSFIKEDRKYHIALSEYILGNIYLQMVEGSSSISPLSIVKNISFLVKNVPFADRKSEAHFKRAIDVAEKVGAKSILSLAFLDWGLLHKAKKRKAPAIECISKAIEIFEQFEADVYLAQAHKELESLQ